jgi:hypothetical protein
MFNFNLPSSNLFVREYTDTDDDDDNDGAERVSFIFLVVFALENQFGKYIIFVVQHIRDVLYVHGKCNICRATTARYMLFFSIIDYVEYMGSQVEISL